MLDRNFFSVEQKVRNHDFGKSQTGAKRRGTFYVRKLDFARALGFLALNEGAFSRSKKRHKKGSKNGLQKRKFQCDPYSFLTGL